jgi:hypothetical protein
MPASTRFPPQYIDEIGVAHDGELNRLARLIVQTIDHGLGAPRQIDLAQAGRAQMQDPRTQGVGPASGAARHVTPIVQGRNKMMTGRDVEPGRRGNLGQLGFATRVGDDVQDQEGAIERLNPALVAAHRRPGRHYPDVCRVSFHRRFRPKLFRQ